MRFLLPAVLLLFAYSPSYASSNKMGNEQIIEKINAKMALCTTPDDSKKTCGLLAYYARVNDKKVTEHEYSIIEGVNVKSTTMMELNNGRLCKKNTAESINDYELTSDNAEAVKKVRRALQEVVDMLNGTYECMEFVVQDKKIVSRYLLDGKHIPEFDSEVKWVPHNHYTPR